MAVSLTYATCTGHALIDRAWYLPKSWADDTERRAAAGVADDVEFAIKPALAQEMILACWMAACPLGGWPVTRSTALTPACVPNYSGCWPWWCLSSAGG